MSDEDLMAAVRGGDRDAFGELFGRYQERIWRFFRRRLADRTAAEELTQETFLAVLQGAARYAPRAPFRSYLFGIAFNLLAAARRRRSNSSLDGANAAEPIAGSSDQVLVLWVRQAIAGLDSNDREILLLREYDQLTYEEIAALLSLPVGTVRSRLFRARLALKQRLDAPRPQEIAR
jgi:RNA polymerase sigma-70 factor, ECF subfamily